MKFRASKEFLLVSGRLYTRGGLDAKGVKAQRFIPRDEDVFDVIVEAHIELLHPGQEKTFHEIERTTAGISKKEVRELLQHCLTCAKKGSQKTKAPLKPIVENSLWGRVQIDLIDMQCDPDDEMKWICHLRDHFSKYSVACPMPNKSSEEVVKVVLMWIMHLGPPKILQSDNGTEFKGALTLLLRQHGIQVINGRPRHPQSQGMIEKANHVLKDKIAAWQSDHQSSCWVQSIPEVITSMNAQRSSVTGKSPYEIAFGQAPHGTRVSYLVREQQEVQDEDGEEREIGDHFPIVAGDSILPEIDNIEDNRLVVSPESRETQSLKTILALEINSGLSNQSPDDPVGQSIALELQSGGVESLSPNHRAQAKHSAAILDIRSSARSIAARSREQMVKRDLQRNPPLSYSPGSLITVRIPKKNRVAAQNRRLLSRVLAEGPPGRYSLQTEHGILKNTYPLS